MAPVFGTVQMLKPGRSTFGIELRLIRCYENANSFSLEGIFHDREGQRIHVTIPKANIEKFRDQLIEGQVYAIIDFVIGINVMKYKTTGSFYKIIAFKQTRIFAVYHDEFPHHLYELKNFTDIANMKNMGDAALFDVVGSILSHYRPLTRDINGKPTKLMDLVLEDVDGNTITATLWENYADQMLEFLESRPEAPVAVILQFCRPNVYRGDVRVSSLFNVTKIVLDQKVDEIADFNSRYITTGKVRTASISTLTSSSSRSIHDEIRDGDFEMRTIFQMMTDGKIGNFWIYATILCVETIGDWSYLACKKCQKKIKTSGNQFFCEKCQSFDIAGKLRYKLTVRVVDDSGTTTFLMWDKESIALIGKTAAELTLGRSNEGIPPGLEKLANKKALFNVTVQPGQARNYTGSYSVARICTDREIIKKMCGEVLPDEDVQSISVDGSELTEEMIGSSTLKTSVQSKSRAVIKKTIQQIMEDGESGQFNVHATINDIEDIIGMSYLACKICRKELDPYIELKFFCEKCQSFDICGITRYKLIVEVSDSTATTTLHMTDKQCMEFLGQKLEEDESLEVLPSDIEKIAHQKGLFTIIVLPGQHNDNKGPYGVVKVAREDIVESEGSEKQGTSSKSNKGKEKVEEFADEVNLITDSIVTPRKKNMNTCNAVVIRDDVDVKRNLIDEFSATTQKRTKRLVKKEKQ